MSSTLWDAGINIKATLGEIPVAANLTTWTVALALVLSIGVWTQAGRHQENGYQKTSSELKAVNQQPSPGDVQQLNVRVARLLVHPIKSCRGIPVQKANYTPEGVEFDRLWAVMDNAKQTIITARETAKMVLITPEIERDESSPYLGRLVVKFPSDSGCETFSVPLRPTGDILQDWETLPEIKIFPAQKPVDGYICQSTSDDEPSPSEVLSKFFGKSVHLIYKGPRPRNADATPLFPDLKATSKYQDMYPLLVLSEESMPPVERELRDHVGTQGIQERWKTGSVVIERFRPNITFSGGGPFAEDGWEEITIGAEDAPTISIVSKCTRCLLPNVSPETGERDGAVPYKILMKFRTGLDPRQKMKPCVGCNAVPAGSGVVQVGDRVYIKKVLKSMT